jgi:hypothetical protein
MAWRAATAIADLPFTFFQFPPTSDTAISRSLSLYTISVTPNKGGARWMGKKTTTTRLADDSPLQRGLGSLSMGSIRFELGLRGKKMQ